ncbi:S8 family serine peptidase [Faecalicatena contorta]|uniref:S8 family peptidase n=1 Tax=Faecalicatena contorta TaxID=39482 RepID=UPI001F3B4EE9|nr:S8 family peptidase [Faecalicatena contorta]MCF2679505.1 S8 family serine peptidase [Faecalicatena contorta]
MTSQKVENLLNLALDASQQEREKSLELDVGYDSADREWDLIVKYSGNLEKVREIAVRVIELMNEYAILRVRESDIEKLAGVVQIEYIEKPKRLYFALANGKRVSCINEVQGARFSLYGQGILVAILDSGIDYTLPEFRTTGGMTRIRNLWDQSLMPLENERAPEGYDIGVEYTREEIDAALQLASPEERMRIVRSRDTSGHGTAVTGIAAGIAAASELLIVKLGNPGREGFPRTTELMMGLDYVIRKALEYQMPVAVNLSFGNTYGSHNGTSLLERFIDDISNIWKNVICIGTGNEAASAGHTSGRINDEEAVVIELAVQERQPSLNIQIWKSYTDVIDISLVSPSGYRIGPIQEVLGPQRFRTGNTEILLYYGEPSPYSTDQEIFIDMLPVESYIDSGVWRIILSPREVVSGEYELWLPSEGALNRGTGFLFPTDTTTLTIPSTAARAISVGAYDALTFTYADFSGRGPIAGDGGWMAKPDIAAPGVNVITTAVGGGQAAFSGTSFAAPFVTGGAALLMDWGITKGNDPYLYGEKVKAYFHRGARPLPGFAVYPNSQVGYGALCVKDSLPV